MARRRTSNISTKRNLASEFNEESSPRVLKAARKIAPITGGAKLPRRYRPGTVALRQIKKYQKSAELLITKMAFHRLTRETVHRHTDNRVPRMTSNCIQEFTELHFAHLLDDANYCAIHRNRVSIYPKDLQIVRMIRGEIPKRFRES